jgi:DNA-binding MarR family transcriptional regulator
MRIDAFLQESPMFAINHAARRFNALAAVTLKADDLSFLEGLILTALFFETSALIKPSDLAETLGMTRGNVSHCISSLEAKGLLHRRIVPTDARAYHLTLKPKGRKCAVGVISAFDNLQKEFEKEVGKAALRDTLRTIRRLESVFQE